MNYTNTNKSLYDDIALWEKCHTLYYIKKGTITFDSLEKVEVMNFVKLSSQQLTQLKTASQDLP